MRSFITLFFTLSLAIIANAGLVTKGEGERALADALAKNDQFAADSARQKITGAEESIKYGGILCATIIGIPGGIAVIAAGEESDKTSMDCWRQVVDTMNLTDEEEQYYSKHGMPIERVFELSDIRVYGPTENKPIRFVRNGVEFVPRVTYSSEQGCILHMDARRNSALIGLD